MLAPIRQGGCTSSPTLEGDRLGPTTPAAGSYNLGEMVHGVSPMIPFQRTTVNLNRKKSANQVFKDVTTLHRVKTRTLTYLWTAMIAVSMRNTSEGTRGERRVSSVEGKGVPRAEFLNCSQALTRMCSTDSPKRSLVSHRLQLSARLSSLVSLLLECEEVTRSARRRLCALPSGALDAVQFLRELHRVVRAVKETLSPPSL